MRWCGCQRWFHASSGRRVRSETILRESRRTRCADDLPAATADSGHRRRLGHTHVPPPPPDVRLASTFPGGRRRCSRGADRLAAGVEAPPRRRRGVRLARGAVRRAAGHGGLRAVAVVVSVRQPAMGDRSAECGHRAHAAARGPRVGPADLARSDRAQVAVGAVVIALDVPIVGNTDGIEQLTADRTYVVSIVSSPSSPHRSWRRWCFVAW